MIISIKWAQNNNLLEFENNLLVSLEITDGLQNGVKLDSEALKTFQSCSKTILTKKTLRLASNPHLAIQTTELINANPGVKRSGSYIVHSGVVAFFYF